jgi:ribosomal protein S18 acetylase RimI-like enzyme
MTSRTKFTVPERVGSQREVDFSAPAAPDYGPLARDLIPVRSTTEADLAAIIAIDRAITGRDRSRYIERRLAEVLQESDVRVSLVAEQDGRPVGFVMARVNLGEFGRAEATAEMDTIGIDPDYRGRGVGRALLSQLLANLATLRVEKVLTEVEWSDSALIAFLTHCGFHPSSLLAFDCCVDPA